MERQNEYPDTGRGRLRLVSDTDAGAPRHRDAAVSYWDAIPRDGPAVFVADARQLNAGIIRGCWLDLTRTEEELAETLAATFAEASADAWQIIDQVGVGPQMLPETSKLPELLEAAQRWGKQ